VKTYSSCGAKQIKVYDTASNCLTTAYKQNNNNHYILKLKKDGRLQNIVTFMLRIIFKCQN